ncbi:MAG: TlyA family RNA methyltransferase [Desulfobacteraceae bacterium]|nr:TlyA family RNA methyltransferase [Desulfobacteraceae bacterium]
MPAKKRLDLLVFENGLTPSRQRARAMIMAGRVLVDTVRVDKPGALVPSGAQISIKGQDLPFVSRGGLKLEAALKELNFQVQDFVCIDIGASTGGFTDCLLQNGARHVYAVDVGYGQLAWQLRQDPRVTSIERTNIRNLPVDRISDPADLATIDVSFISLKIVVPNALKFIKPNGSILALVKPQFEVGKKNVGKGGVVRDAAVQRQVIESLATYFEGLNLRTGPIVPSPILGPKGNQEYMLLLRHSRILL